MNEIQTLIDNLQLIQQGIRHGDRESLTKLLHKAKIIKEELGE